MKSKVVLSAAAVVVVAAVVILAVYLRPRSFNACAGFDPAEVTRLDVHLSPYDNREPLDFTLTPGDPDYQALVDLLDQQQYRRKFPSKPTGYPAALDYWVFLDFYQEGPPNTVNFFGCEILSFLEGAGSVTISGLTAGESIAFQQEILDLLLAAAPQTEAAS